MPNQPATIQQRIAEILLQHTARHESNGGDLWLNCGCGDKTRFYDRRKHGAHVAEVLVSELGLKTEIAQDSEPGSPREFRYATDWTPDV